MEECPLVSIIIPAYNAEQYIIRSLESAAGQTYKNIEIIVVNDGSTDRTAEIIKTYDDPRVVYLYQENRGQGAARNYGIKNSKGRYITFLDADDFYLPTKIERQVQYLQEHQQYKIVYCNALHFYSNEPNKLLKKKNKCPSGDILGTLLRSSLINPNTIMLHREVLSDERMFNESRSGRYCEEWELYLKIARAGFEFGYLDADLVVVEIRADSHTQWDIQWIMKQKVLEMFEALFSGFSQEEKEVFQVDKIVKNARFKLAIACLIGKKKKLFLETFVGLYRYPMRAFVYLIGVCMLLCSVLLRGLLIWMWKANQLRSFVPVNINSARLDNVDLSRRRIGEPD